MEANEEIAKETAHVNDNQSSKTKVALQLPENSSIDEPPAKKPKISTNSSKPSEWACMVQKSFIYLSPLNLRIELDILY